MVCAKVGRAGSIHNNWPNVLLYLECVCSSTSRESSGECSIAGLKGLSAGLHFSIFQSLSMFS